MQLTEKYRPGTWSEVIGQDKAVNTLRRLSDRNSLGGRAILISGKSGTGKTTLARIAASKIASSLAIEEYNAKEVSISDIERMEGLIQKRALAKAGEPTGRAWIFNEVHLFRRDIVGRLLTTLEPGMPLPDFVLILFTTTREESKGLFGEVEDSTPLASRCLRIELAQRDLADSFAQHMARVAIREELATGDEDEVMKRCLRIVKDERNNLRAGLQRVEAGELL